MRRENKVHKIYRNIVMNEACFNEIKALNKRITELESNINNVYKNSNELVFRSRFTDATKHSWLDIPIALSDFAIGYDFAYLLFMILDNIKPLSILELGLGQSSKIVNEYIKWNRKANHHVVEHNKDWIDFFKKKNKLTSKTKVHFLANETTIFKGAEINSYKDFANEFKNDKFDLILVDGPNGNGQNYSRTDILNILPRCLNKSFVILIDDVNRIGERNTAMELEKILKEHNVSFVSSFSYQGITNVYICTSSDLGFLTTI